MKSFLFIFFIFIFTQSIFAQFDAAKIAGTYKWCPFPCETYKINEDFTFDYLVDGDLFNNERTSGTWKFVSGNKIHLQSPERKLINRVTEKQKPSNGKILVQVVDTSGAIFPGIILKTKNVENEKQYVTDNEEICEIPNTDEIEITWLRFSEKYKIKDSKTNYVTFEIPATNEPFIKETFLVKNRQLFAISEDNKILENGYKKFSKKVSNKLFPKN